MQVSHKGQQHLIITYFWWKSVKQLEKKPIQQHWPQWKTAVSSRKKKADAAGVLSCVTAASVKLWTPPIISRWASGLKSRCTRWQSDLGFALLTLCTLDTSNIVTTWLWLYKIADNILRTTSTMHEFCCPFSWIFILIVHSVISTALHLCFRVCLTVINGSWKDRCLPLWLRVLFFYRTDDSLLW